MTNLINQLPRQIAPRSPLRVETGRCASIALAVACLLLQGCSSNSSPAGKKLLLAGKTMGTTYHVTLVSIPKSATRGEVHGAIDGLLATINQQMSTYIESSELSRFNASRSTDWFEVSAELATVVNRALEISEQSQGAFDVTVGPLVNLWNFGPNRTKPQVPDDAAIKAALQATGFQALSVRQQPPALRKAKANLYVDLSAIAKGYAVDAVAELLDNYDIADYLVEIGGEVRAKGLNQDRQAWRLGIEAPTRNRSLSRVVPLTDQAMATSGDYRNFHLLDGKRYSHTINPQTGRPVTHDLGSASVIADDCITSDAWATALMVLGPKRGLEMATKHGLPVFLVARSGKPGEETILVESSSAEFQRLFGTKKDE